MEENYIEEPVLKPSSSLKAFFDILESFVYAIVAVVFVFTFFAKLTIVEGSSMEGTLQENDYLIVADPMFAYQPSQGDIVVIQGNFYGELYDHPIVKRVIATGGQTVKIDFINETVYVDGKVFDDPETVCWIGSALSYDYHGKPKLDSDGNIVLEEVQKFVDNQIVKYKVPVIEESYFTQTSEGSGIFEATIPEGHIFVLGDNRYNSADSRCVEIGFIPEKYVLGKAIFRILPFKSIGGL